MRTKITLRLYICCVEQKVYKKLSFNLKDSTVTLIFYPESRTTALFDWFDVDWFQYGVQSFNRRSCSKQFRFSRWKSAERYIWNELIDRTSFCQYRSCQLPCKYTFKLNLQHIIICWVINIVLKLNFENCIFLVK